VSCLTGLPTYLSFTCLYEALRRAKSSRDGGVDGAARARGFLATRAVARAQFGDGDANCVADGAAEAAAGKHAGHKVIRTLAATLSDVLGISNTDVPLAPVDFNQASPSAYVRANARAVPYALAYMQALKIRGVRVLDGGDAFAPRAQQMAQATLLHELGVPTPRKDLYRYRG
jgi:hypothetical protein